MPSILTYSCPTCLYERHTAILTCQVSFSKENFPRIEFDVAKHSGAHPRVFSESLSQDHLIRCIKDEHGPMFQVFQRTTQNYKVFVGESFHKHGMFIPSFLISHRPLLIPRWSLLVDHNKVWHIPASGLSIDGHWFQITVTL